jgi:hypothetical protein
MNEGEPILVPMIGLDCVLSNIPVPPPPMKEGVVGDNVKGVAPCEELLVRRVEGVIKRDDARANKLVRGRVGGGVISLLEAGVV